MFTTSKALNPKDHSQLTLLETSDYSFAADLMFIPIVLSEIADVAREYPLVFIGDQPMPVALTGVEKGLNAYVAEDGSWRAHYIPGSIQGYPFTLGAMPNKPGEFAIVFDPEAAQLTSPAGAPLFDSQNKPMANLRKRMDLLTKIKKAEPVTHRMVKELRESGLLMDRAIRINRPDGEDSQITGIQVVDESKFNGLSGKEFLALRDKGLLPLIYSHLLSMANLRQGVIAGKYPDLAARPAPSETTTTKRGSEVDLDTFFADDGDFDLDFDA
jgi:hypothetical protein